MKLNHWAATAAMVVCGASAAWAGDATYTINVTGVVPVICRVTANTTTLDNSSPVTLVEFCNNPTGYQVWADTPAGATAVLNLNGNTVQLSSSGSTLIDTWATSASVTRTLTVSGAQGLNAISFRVVPI
jgi:hypothetical protein